jgi:hypothetical protein
MGALTPIISDVLARDAEPLDEIRLFMGNDIGPEEYEQRRRIRACRDAAAYQATQTECSAALQLLWLVTEYATAYVYSGATLERLTEVAPFLRRLLIVADQAEELEPAL